MLFLAALIAGLAGCGAASSAHTETAPSSLFSDDELIAKKVQCLKDAGWDARVEQGSIVAEVSESQAEKYRAASAACSDRVGMVENGLTPQQFVDTYDWYEAIADCLVKNGWDVPPKPSFQAFKDTYDSDPWIPWIDIKGEELPRASEKCPVMNPPGR